MRTPALLAISALCALPVATLAQQDFANWQTVVSGLSAPVGVEFPAGDDSRFFVVEQTGRIRLVTVGGTPSAPTYTLQATPFLDVAALITGPSFPTTPALTRGNEQGLLGLALAPDFATSGTFYINYTAPRGSTFVSQGATFDNGRTIIAKYQRDPGNPSVALPTGDVIMQFDQPFTNHNGGCINFGPDGMLWIATGDGGSGNDPNNDALDPNELLGKMLRIDPSSDAFPADALRDYAIPAGNAGLARPEIWARGLRNPWRFSFDRWNGDLWIGDVGQNLWEEVNRVSSSATGLNFGWRVREGNRVTGLSAGAFDVSSLVAPVYVYPHATNQADIPVAGSYSSAQIGISIAGGIVYRGGAIRPYRGTYFFIDTYNSNSLAGFPATSAPGNTPAAVGLGMYSTLMRSTVNTVTPPALANVVDFAEDNAGEMYVVEIGAGRVRKMVPQNTQPRLADIAGAGQTLGADGQYTADDIIVFIGWFFGNDPRADVAGPGQSSALDQQLTADDIIVFINAFFAGQ
jgi:glucose/arabinose dehydrogenase